MSELPAERAWSYALTLLSRRAYSVAEIRERLERKGASSEVVEQTIARLEQYRLVDDVAYAEAYVRSQGGRKGSIALRHELRRRGVPGEASEASLGHLDEAAELANAARLLERHRWRFRSSDARRGRARAFAFLARRGFPSAVVATAVEDSEWLVAPEEESGTAIG